MAAIQQTFDIVEPRIGVKKKASATPHSEQQVHWPPERLDMHPAQPRKRFDDADLIDLRLLMEQQGQLSDCQARPHPDGDPKRLQLLSGNRRQLAVLLDLPLSKLSADQKELAQSLGLKKLAPWSAIRVNVRPLDDDQAEQAVLSDFVSSQGLDDVERAESLAYLVNVRGRTIKEAAASWRIDRTTASRLIKIADLEAAWKTRVRAGMSGRVARELAAYAHCPPLMKLLDRAYKDDSTQFATEAELTDLIDVLIARNAKPLNGVAFWQSPIGESGCLFDINELAADTLERLQVHQVSYAQQHAGEKLTRRVGTLAFNVPLAEELQFKKYAETHDVDTPETEIVADDEEPAEDAQPAKNESAKTPKTISETTAGVDPLDEEAAELRRKAAAKAEKQAAAVRRFALNMIGLHCAISFGDRQYAEAKLRLLLVLAGTRDHASRISDLAAIQIENHGGKKNVDLATAIQHPVKKGDWIEVVYQSIGTFLFNGWKGKETGLDPEILLWFAAETDFDAERAWAQWQEIDTKDDERQFALGEYLSIFDRDQLLSIAKELATKDLQDELQTIPTKAAVVEKVEWMDTVASMPKALKSVFSKLKK